MKATYDDSNFTLTGKVWSATYPLDELPRWLAFYRSRESRFPKAGDSYNATITALEALQRQLAGRG